MRHKAGVAGGFLLAGVGLLVAAVIIVHHHQLSVSALSAGQSLWTDGYLMAAPGYNMNEDYVRGERKGLFSPSGARAGSNKKPEVLKARYQSLCLGGAACESYDDQAEVMAERLDRTKVDDKLPKEIPAAIQKEVSSAIDAYIDESDLTHHINAGSRTNAFKARPQVAVLASAILPASSQVPRGRGAAYEVRRAMTEFQKFMAVADGKPFVPAANRRGLERPQHAAIVSVAPPLAPIVPAPPIPQY